MANFDLVDELTNYTYDAADPMREMIVSNDIPFLDRYRETRPKLFYTGLGFIENNALYISPTDYNTEHIGFFIGVSE